MPCSSVFRWRERQTGGDAGGSRDESWMSASGIEDDRLGRTDSSVTSDKSGHGRVSLSSRQRLSRVVVAGFPAARPDGLTGTAGLAGAARTGGAGSGRFLYFS